MQAVIVLLAAPLRRFAGGLRVRPASSTGASYSCFVALDTCEHKKKVHSRYGPLQGIVLRSRLEVSYVGINVPFRSWCRLLTVSRAGKKSRA